jgi:hypothetical protein
MTTAKTTTPPTKTAPSAGLKYRDRAAPPFFNNGLKRRNWQQDRGRLAPNTKKTTGRASHDDCSASGGSVVELWWSQPAPAPTLRNSTAGLVGTAPTAEAIAGMCGTTWPSFLLPQEPVLKSLGPLLPKVSSRPLPPFLSLTPPFTVLALGRRTPPIILPRFSATVSPPSWSSGCPPSTSPTPAFPAPQYPPSTLPAPPATSPIVGGPISTSWHGCTPTVWAAALFLGLPPYLILYLFISFIVMYISLCKACSTSECMIKILARTDGGKPEKSSSLLLMMSSRPP